MRNLEDKVRLGRVYPPCSHTLVEGVGQTVITVLVMGFTKSVLTENPWCVTLKVIKGILDLSLESVGSGDAIYCAAY